MVGYSSRSPSLFSTAATSVTSGGGTATTTAEHHLLLSKPRSHSRKQKAIDRNHIKKPLNAFMLYMKEMRPKIVAECTLKESAAINQILGRRVSNKTMPYYKTSSKANLRFFLQWHSLNRDEQAKYYELARKERQLHMQMYPGWSARDNYAQNKKKKRKKIQEMKSPGGNSNPSAATVGIFLGQKANHEEVQLNSRPSPGEYRNLANKIGKHAQRL